MCVPFRRSFVLIKSGRGLPLCAKMYMVKLMLFNNRATAFIIQRCSLIAICVFYFYTICGEIKYVVLCERTSLISLGVAF